MAAAGLKLGLVAGAALVVLVPTFNSLNQVTVEDTRPPFTLDDPPPDLPPPEDGDDEIDIPPPQSSRPRPQCPPATAELLWEYSWDFPAAGGGTEEVSVSPGANQLVFVGNLSNYVGSFTFTLAPPGEAQAITAYEFSSQDGEGVGNKPFFQGEVSGPVPGPWTARIDQGLIATGHADLQLYQVFLCGGARGG